MASFFLAQGYGGWNRSPQKNNPQKNQKNQHTILYIVVAVVPARYIIKSWRIFASRGFINNSKVLYKCMFKISQHFNLYFLHYYIKYDENILISNMLNIQCTTTQNPEGYIYQPSSLVYLAYNQVWCLYHSFIFVFRIHKHNLN